MDEDISPSEPVANDPGYFPDFLADHIRKRPGVYIGGTGPAYLHALADELISFSMDEILSGHGDRIDVRVSVDGSLTVADNGRGIPAEVHPKLQLAILELVMTVRGNSTSVDWFPRGERISGAVRSLHGVGARTITALSDRAEAVVCCKGRTYRQQYERGRSVGDVCDIGAADGLTGTRITFHPDPEIFRDVSFEWDRLQSRLRELAFLNKGLLITLRDERSGKDETFQYDGGLADFILYLNSSKEVLHKPVYIDSAIGGMKVEAVLQYTTGEEEQVRCYANNVFSAAGGTPQLGFRSALTRTLIECGNNANFFKNAPMPIGKDFRAGLTAVISVQVPGPQFESRNMHWLCNPEVKPVVARAVRRALRVFLNENPGEAHQIITKAISAAKARE